MVVGLIAEQSVIAAAADGVLDQRAQIPLVEQGIGDVARSVVDAMGIGAVVGQLRCAAGRPATRGQVDRFVAGEVAEIICIIAVAVPDGAENPVAVGYALTDTVDEHFAGHGAEGIDGVRAVGSEIGAVEILQGGDIVLHIGLGLVELVALEADVVAGVRAVGHHRPGLAVVAGGQGGRAEMWRCIADKACEVLGRIVLVSVFQPKCMADFVHQRRLAPVADLWRQVKGLAAPAQPDVAIGRVVTREVALRRALVGAGGLCQADRTVGIGGLRHLGEGEIGVAGHQGERVLGGSLLRRVERNQFGG